MTMIYAHLVPDYLDREMQRVKFLVASSGFHSSPPPGIALAETG